MSVYIYTVLYIYMCLCDLFIGIHSKVGFIFERGKLCLGGEHL